MFKLYVVDFDSASLRTIVILYVGLAPSDHDDIELYAPKGGEKV